MELIAAQLISSYSTLRPMIEALRQQRPGLSDHAAMRDILSNRLARSILAETNDRLIRELRWAHFTPAARDRLWAQFPPGRHLPDMHEGNPVNWLDELKAEARCHSRRAKVAQTKPATTRSRVRIRLTEEAHP